MLYGWNTLCLLSDVVFLILRCAGITIFFAVLTALSGFMVLQQFQVSQELSVYFQSQRPSFFFQIKI